jgi:hypothetical protein
VPTDARVSPRTRVSSRASSPRALVWTCETAHKLQTHRKRVRAYACTSMYVYVYVYAIGSGLGARAGLCVSYWSVDKSVRPASDPPKGGLSPSHV